jgi:trypsin-like peptidase
LTPPVEGIGPNALEAAVLRIRDKRGEPVGAGFLVSDGLALTCAHVVSAALGIAGDVEPAASARIHLDLPLLAAGAQVTASVERWEAPSDVAVLRLSASPPRARPVRLVEAQDMWEHPVRAFGFPAGRPGGVWHSGVVRARQADGWLQADLAGDGYRVSRGFSGTPVWDERLVGMVGMVTVTEAGEPADWVVWKGRGREDGGREPVEAGVQSRRPYDRHLQPGRQDARRRRCARRPHSAAVGRGQAPEGRHPSGRPG